MIMSCLSGPNISDIFLAWHQSAQSGRSETVCPSFLMFSYCWLHHSNRCVFFTVSQPPPVSCVFVCVSPVSCVTANPFVRIKVENGSWNSYSHYSPQFIVTTWQETCWDSGLVHACLFANEIKRHKSGCWTFYSVFGLYSFSFVVFH